MRAASNERLATAELLALLGELDVRKLYLGEGCSSLFTYCTQVLHLSEHAAYHRIEVARAARRFPTILTLVADGALTLTTVALLQSHLTPENHTELLTAARHKSKREVEHQIASLAPKPDAKTLIRRISDGKPAVNALLTQHEPMVLAATESRATATCVPAPAKAPTTTTAARLGPAPAIAPLTSDGYLLRVTLSAEAHANLRRAQDLMRHTIPSGDAAAVLEHALRLLVERLEHGKAAKSHRPRTPASKPIAASDSGAKPGESRCIPAHVRREVWARDLGRCAFVGPQGRCTETGRLEYHHVLPFARGGTASVANIALRCRAHNRFEGEAIFGPWARDPRARSGPSRLVPERCDDVSSSARGEPWTVQTSSGPKAPGIQRSVAPRSRLGVISVTRER